MSITAAYCDTLLARMKDPAPGKTDTSREAAEKIAPAITGLRKQVYDFIVDHKEFGATSDEIDRNTGINLLSVRPRLTELKQAGLICDSDRRRPNRGGRREIVFIATEGAANG